MDRPWIRTTFVLCVFAVVFIALTVGSYTQKSATADEPQHLTAGYTALRLHDYRIDPEHPPFLRMWAALPLLAMPDVRLDTNTVSWQTGQDWPFSHHFLYELNDADRLLYRARFMTVVLGIALGLLIFSWAHELFGFWTAATVLALYCLEPNILAHSGLVTTDLGVTCFIFGALYFLWRLTRRFTCGNAAGLAVFFALAQVSKFSALVLGPIVMVLFLVHVLRKSAWPYQFGSRGELRSLRPKLLAMIAVILLLAVASYAAVWAVYGFHYGPTVANTDLAIVQENPEVLRTVPIISAVANWFDRHRLLPDTYTRGLQGATPPRLLRGRVPSHWLVVLFSRGIPGQDTIDFAHAFYLRIGAQPENALALEKRGRILRPAVGDLPWRRHDGAPQHRVAPYPAHLPLGPADLRNHPGRDACEMATPFPPGADRARSC
jgi:hypothetical protein